MDNHFILQLAQENQMGGVDTLVNAYWALSSVLTAGVDGEVVEIGCYEGRMSVLLQKVIDHFAPERELHVYDSFQGVPPPGPYDGEYVAGGALRANPENLLKTFARWSTRPPVIHAGWFADTLPAELPDRLCFAYLDGDLYESVLTSLEHVYPRLSPRAVVLVDDYCDPEKSPNAFAMFPGPKRACDEFLAGKPETMSVLVGAHNLAAGYFRKS